LGYLTAIGLNIQQVCRINGTLLKAIIISNCSRCNWQYENIHKPRFFKKVRAHAGTQDVVVPAEADLDVFTKPTTVVVACCLCISNGLRSHTAAIQIRATFFSVNTIKLVCQLINGGAKMVAVNKCYM